MKLKYFINFTFKLVLTGFGLFVAVTCSAQPTNKYLNDIQAPSPEAAALGHYVETPVGTFTGVPNISIPIHTLQEGPLSHSISLGYNASGVRVSEASSCVGMGWNLNAGGMISRTILGIADEAAVNGWLTNGGAVRLKLIAIGELDGEPDLFTFSTGDYSGKFVINRDLSVIQYPASDYKITPVDISLNEFIITAPDGRRFYYGSSEAPTVYQGFSTFYGGSGPITLQDENEGQKSNPTSTQKTEWYLRQIESYDGNFQIDFAYREETYTLVNRSSTSRSFIKAAVVIPPSDGSSSNWFEESNYSIPQTSLSLYNENLGGHPITAGDGMVKPIYVNWQGLRTKKLLSITSSTEKVTFQKESTQRLDLDDYAFDGSGSVSSLPNAYALKSITVKPISGNKYTKRYNLAHCYIDSSPDPQYSYEKRLALLSIDPPGNIPPYVFKYGAGFSGCANLTLPHRLTKAVDKWGFYNGEEENNNLYHNIPEINLHLVSPNGIDIDQTFGMANRSTYEEPMLLGALTSITFPEGGRTEYTYEANTILDSVPDPVPVKPMRQLRIPPLYNCDYENPTPASCCLDPANETDLTVVSLDWYLTNRHHDKGVFKIYIKDPGCLDDADPDFFRGQVNLRITRLDGSFVIPVFQFTDDFPRPFTGEDHLGQFIYKPIAELFQGYSFNEGNYTISMETYGAVGLIDYYEYVYNVFNRKVGGLRVNRVATYDRGGGAIVSSTDYDYNAGNTGFSSGLLYGGEPQLGQAFATGSDPDLAPHLQATAYISFNWQDSPILPTTDVSGYHVGYQEVTATHANGSKTQYFHEANQLNFDQFNFPQVPYDYDFGNGNLLEKIDQLSTGSEVQRSTTQYSLRDYFNSGDIAYRAQALFSQSIQTEAYAFNRFNRQSSSINRPFINRHTLDGVETETVTAYHLGTELVGPRYQRITGSDGTQYENHYRYAIDLAEAGFGSLYSFLHSNFNLKIPLEEYRSVNGVIVDGTRREYGYFENNGRNPAPYPSKISRLETTYDENGNQIGPTSDPNQEYETQLVFNEYAGGLPRRATVPGWNFPYVFTWEDGGLLAQKEFGSFTWNYSYYPGTRLLNSMTNIDGQSTVYDYDDQGRLSFVSARGGGVTTQYAYNYFGQDSERRMAHLATTTNFTPTEGSNLTTLETYSYVDGIGRPLQTVHREHHNEGGSWVDVVTGAVQYDQMKRVVSQFEPFASGNSNGNFVPVTEITSGATTTAYYEDPLGRVQSISPPELGSTTFFYGNNSGSEVINYHNGGDSYYPAASLFKQTTIDPDGNIMHSFKDKRGRAILSTQVNDGTNHDTYTYYDPKDRITTIYPPSADASTQGLLFKYLYDGADNLIAKKIPDQAALSGDSYSERIWYNQRNLPTFFKNNSMLEGFGYLVNYYDAYGRNARNGFTNTLPSNGETVAGTVEAVLSTAQYTDSGVTAIQPTRITQRTLTTNGLGVPLATQFGYDQFGRTTSVTGNLLLNRESPVAQSMSTAYDFADNVMAQIFSYEFDATSLSIEERSTVDRSGRLTAQFQQITHDGTVEAEEQLSSFTYTAKDQVKQLNLGGTSEGFLQTIDYRYLKNGFLTHINDPSAPGDDLFSLSIGYDLPSPDAGSSPLYNGNISSLVSHVPGGAYFAQGFGYDGLNRLTSASFTGLEGGIGGSFGSQYRYDQRGNITYLERNGQDSLGASGIIDQLNYAYQPNSNTLKHVSDDVNQALHAEGFTAINPTDDYVFDPAGNLKYDPAKDLKISYNHLNLPAQFTRTDEGVHEYVYLANGTKLRETITAADGTKVQRDYLGGAEYVDSVLAFVNHAHGRFVPRANQDGGNLDCPPILWVTEIEELQSTFRAIQVHSEIELPGEAELNFYGETLVELHPGFATPANTDFTADLRQCIEIAPTGGYEYFLTDHLGNNRVLFSDRNGDGTVDSTEIIQENHYYAFGMEMNGGWQKVLRPEQRYRYNGIEHSEELGLDLAAYRSYDAAIGRWLQIDPLAELAPGWTPYRFGFNNPIKFTDPLGLFESRKAARAHARANGIRTGLFRDNKISKQDDGSYAIENKESGAVTFEFTDADGDKSIISGGTVSERAPRISEMGVDAALEVEARNPNAVFRNGIKEQAYIWGHKFGIVSPSGKIAKASTTVVNAATKADDVARLPVGVPGSPMQIVTQNTPRIIDGTKFTGHALDRMQGRGIISPRAVLDVIRNATKSIPGNSPGTTIHFKENLKVITNSGGDVITVMKQ